jgi:hypothetical protein
MSLNARRRAAVCASIIIPPELFETFKESRSKKGSRCLESCKMLRRYRLKVKLRRENRERQIVCGVLGFT